MMLLASIGTAGAFIAIAPESAQASTLDATGVSLKFKQANRVPVVTGATGRTAGDLMKYTSVATINGTVIDAVVRTAEITGATVTKFDEGSAVTSPPPGSSQSVDDLLLTDISGSAAEARATLEFTFYEGGTYTGPGSGVPVTLSNVIINTYDIDGNAGVKQFTDFRGFQSYNYFTASPTQGLDVIDKGSGLVRFQSRDGSTNVGATSGSYSFARLQVNYDQVSTLTVRIGELGSQTAYYALDFSAGGIWTTNGTTALTPSTAVNPFNTPPTTSDITTFYAAQGTGYAFRSADFPYSDLDRNPFSSLTIVSLPASGAGSLQYDGGTGWAPATAGQPISTSDLDLGRLRLIPTAAGGSFAFSVNDGLDDSSTSTLAFTAPISAQTITFPTQPTQSGSTSHTFASGATASSGLPPVLESQTPGVCTVSGLDITTLALPVGTMTATCVVTATQAGDSDFGRAASVTQQFPVSNLLAQTITFTDPGDRTFSSSTITTDAQTTAPARSVTLASSTPSVCTISGTSIVPVSPGLCSVRATQAGDATYSPASPVSRAFTLAKIPQTITFVQPGTQPIDATGMSVSPATSATGLSASVASTTTSVCTVSGSSVTLHSTGLCTLVASQSGDATRAAATSVARSFRVLAVTTTSLDQGDVGTAYSQTLTEAGGIGGGTWSVAGALPAGLSLDAATGVLSGTPTAAFSGRLVVGYTENGATHTRDLGLSIRAATTVTATGSTAAPSAASLPASNAPTDGGLAGTGIDASWPLLIGASLLTVGAISFWIARRRRPSSALRGE
ncbi:putative Ig domain-containing protein [Naasia lichenicola]|nr:putative Ig domain-containing protein [Naasia lichenicola]